MQEARVDAARKENISQISVDKNIKIPINLDEIAKQIASQFNVNINLDEQLNKTATQLKQEYENKYFIPVTPSLLILRNDFCSVNHYTIKYLHFLK